MVAEQPFRSTLDGVKEWNLLSLAYKNAVGSRRAAWRVITSTEQKEKFKGKEELVLHAREYVNDCAHTLVVLVLCIFGTCRAFLLAKVFLTRCLFCQVFMCTRVCLSQGPLSLCLRSFL